MSLNFWLLGLVASVNYFRIIDRCLWTLLIFIASVYIVLAVCMSLGRFYMPQLEKLSPQLVAVLEDKTGLDWQLEGLSGEWKKFRPVFRVDSLVASLPASEDSSEVSDPVFSLDSGELRLDLIASAMDLGLRITHVSAKQLSLSLDKTADDQWALRGMALANERREVSLRGFIQRLQSIQAQQINIDLPGGEFASQRIQLPVMQMHFQQFSQARQFIFTQQGGDAGNFTLYANATGDPFADDTEVDIYAVAEQLSLSPWFVSANNSDQWLVDNWSGQFWAIKKPNQQWRASVAIDNGSIQRNDNSNWQLNNIGLALNVEENNDNGFDLWWQQLDATWRDEPLNMPLASISIAIDKSEVSNILLKMPTVDLGQLTEIVSGSKMLDEKKSAALQSLNIDGFVKQLHLAIPGNQQLASQPNMDFELQAILDSISVKAWKNIPGVTGLSGYLHASSTTGSIELVSNDDFSMDFPKVYHDALLFDQIKGRVSWALEDNRLLLNGEEMRFTMTGDEGSFGGRFYLNGKTRAEDESSHISMYIGVSDSHTSHLFKLLPYTMNRNTQNWITQSEMDGNIVDGGFVYHGSLAKADKHKRSVQMYLNLADTDFNFHPQWSRVTKLDGLMMQLGSDAYVSVYSAEFESLIMSQSQVVVQGAGPDAAVDIDSQLAGGLGDVLNILQTTPLKARLENTIGDWHAEGQLHDAQLRLHVPLKKGDIDRTQVDFTAAISDSEIKMSNIGLTVSDLAGPIAYSSDRGLVSQQLNGSLWGEPINIVLGDYHDNPQLQNGNSVRVDGQFDVDTKNLYNWLKQPALAMTEGVAAMSLRVDHSAAQTILTASSDLVGVALKLPEPLYKDKIDSAPFLLNWHLQTANQPMTISIDNYADMQLNFDRYKMQGGSISIGGASDSIGKDIGVKNNLKSSLSVSGEMSIFNLSEWLPVFDKYQASEKSLKLVSDQSTKKPIANQLLVSDLRLDKVFAFGETFTNSVVSVAELDRRWQFDIESDQLKGRIALPVEGMAPATVSQLEQSSALNKLPLILSSVKDERRYLIDLSYLRIERDDSLATQDKSAANSFLIPANLVAAKINIQQLYWGDRPIGQWQFLLSPSDSAVLVHDIHVDYASMLLSSDVDSGLLWAKNEAGEYTSSLSLIGKSDSIEEFIRRFNSDSDDQSPIKSKRADIVIDLSWQGTPDAFSLYQSEGTLDFKFKDGQFLKTSDSTEGLLKIIGIINFDTLVRRMKLDFSDLYKEGLSFDSVEGRLNIADSVARFNDNPIIVKSPSSQFSLTGEVDLVASTINAELIATLPVASNLPWVAVLTGGLPVAAGMYIASKVFEDELDKISSAVYFIEGSLADPDTRFDRLFDNKSTQPTIKEKSEAAIND